MEALCKGLDRAEPKRKPTEKGAADQEDPPRRKETRNQFTSSEEEFFDQTVTQVTHVEYIQKIRESQKT